VLKQLKRAFECAKECLFGQSEQDLQNRKYVNLAPTHEADENGVYAEALLEATNDREVYNIAVTGPYGSGKSSVIKSFLRKYPGSFLQISLAAFDPSETSEGNGSKPSHDIERSILQQFQYSADASDLSLSRFKRIQSPKWHSFLKPTLFVVGAIAIWLIYKNESSLLNGDYLFPLKKEKWFNYITLIVASTFVLRLAYLIYVSSFGLSLKGISLKDIEIAPVDSGDSSVLNQHLDEIIYFFQVSDYNLVIFEDLDRFKNHEIFVKLREVNALINANPRVKQHVQFLYALRDDMFLNTERTKFFEFIVPIVPIINHSNSIDMVLKQGKRMSLEKHLNRRFLTEVSRYLSDLRLIQNIFNEYAVYAGNLNFSDDLELDANKLLAVLIYKNLLPRDFEKLHKQDGVLAKIISQQDAFLHAATTQIQSKIDQKENLLQAAREQKQRDKTELKSIYAMAIYKKIAVHGRHRVRFDSLEIAIDELTEHPDFEKRIIENDIGFLNRHGHLKNLDMEEIQSEIDPSHTFKDRLTFLDAKAPESIDKINSEIRKLRADLAELRFKAFFELAQLNTEQIDECLSALGSEKEVLRYLLLEGYLDDNYYQYTSLFHAELMSPNDHKFLLKIRRFENPSPDYSIDKPRVVIAAMRESDFGKPFVLNTRLFDHMLSHRQEYGNEIDAALSYISTDFEKCADFFSNYYTDGQAVRELIISLIDAWPEFVAKAAATDDRIQHSANIAAYAEETQLQRLGAFKEPLTNVLAKDTLEVLNQQVNASNLRAFQILSVDVEDLGSLEGHHEAVQTLSQEGLYQLTISNIEVALSFQSSPDQISSLSHKNYTTIRASANEVLKDKIEQDFAHYLKSVLLRLPKNTAEEEEDIIEVLRHEEAPWEDLDLFLSRQEALLPTIDAVPDRFKTSVFRRSKIEATWSNCIEYMNCKNFENDALEEFMVKDVSKQKLLKQDISNDDYFADIRTFIYENATWELGDYRLYVKALPLHRARFPSHFDHQRWEFLITSRVITFSDSAFRSLKDHPDLQFQFLTENIENYLTGALEEEEIEDRLKVRLLEANITNKQKIALAGSLAPSLFEGDEGLVNLITQVAAQPNTSTEEFSLSLRRRILEETSDTNTQIKLLNNFQNHLDNDEIRSLLEVCGDPINKLSQWGPKPKIDKNKENELFAEWLKQREIISTYSVNVFDRIQLNTFGRARV